MATVSITIPDTIVPRVIAAMRAGFPQYAALTDAQCFKQITGDYWRGVLSGYDNQQADAAAAAAAATTRSQAVMTDGSGIG